MFHGGICVYVPCYRWFHGGISVYVSFDRCFRICLPSWWYLCLCCLLSMFHGGVMVSTLATHASGPGSIPVAGGKKERLISLLLNIRGCAPRGSHIT